MLLKNTIISGLLLIPFVGTAAFEFGERERTKRFILELKEPGNLMLEVKKKYRGKQYAELIYIYDEANLRWEQRGSLIELYRQPSYPYSSFWMKAGFMLALLMKLERTILIQRIRASLAVGQTGGIVLAKLR